MIFYVTGPLGAGKSLYGVRKIAKALLEGKAVVGNIELVDNWAEIMARHNPYAKWSKSRRREYARELRTRYHFEADLDVLVHTKIRGRGEGRALLVLDEAHNDLNNREWQKSEQKEFLRWITLLRKKGFYAYIISQHAENTDKGLRRIATAQIQLLNFKQVTKLPFIDVPLLPVPLFLAVARKNDDAMPANVLRKGKPLFREPFTLSWHRRLYGTHQLFGESADDDDTSIWLPSDPDERVARRAALRASLDRMRDEREASTRPTPGSQVAARLRVEGRRR